ncbi:MAG: hypothetical protein WAQ77_00855, partial [Candidatus Acidiferrum sp.]
MQNIRTGSFRDYVMSDDFAQSHSDLDCMFVSVRRDTRPGSLPPDNPVFFHELHTERGYASICQETG